MSFGERHEGVSSRAREAARVLGMLGVIVLGLFGACLGLVLANDYVTDPISRGHHALAALIVAAAACGIFGLASVRSWPRTPRGRSAAAILAVTFGILAFFLFAGRREARERVGDYCAYGAVSAAQLSGCKDHVVEDDISGRDTPAARFAYGDSNAECGADSGPFCEQVLERRDYEEEVPIDQR